MLITCVVPCYNEEQSLPLFYRELIIVEMEMAKSFKVSFENIFIDDGSKDNTLQVLKGIIAENCDNRFLSFSKNFGKEAAIYAGLSESKGDFVVCLDADLQHPPENIVTMFEILQKEDYDSVCMRRVSRKGEPMLRSFFARQFYKIINRLSDTEIVDGATDYRMMSRSMANSVLSLKEYNRFSKGIFSWVGFKTKWLDYVNVERIAGESKWSFFGLFKYALEAIIAFSTTPLVVATFIGLICFLAAFSMMAYIIIKKLLIGDPVQGYASTAAFLLGLGGMQLFFMGIIGQYIAKIYLEVKGRPLYIVAEDSNDK